MSPVALLALLLACSAPSDDTGSPTDTASDTSAGDTSSADTSSGDTSSADTSSGDSDTGTAGVYAWEVTTLTVGGRRDGFDLDGDGETDNALWVAQSVLDPAFATALDGASALPVVQISGADDLVDDPEVLLGLFAGRPTGETDSAGLVVVDGGVSVDEDGVARAVSDATLAGGVYSAVLADGTLTIGDYTLESAVGVPVAGGADLGYTTGMIGLAIPLQSLLDLAASLGVDTSSLDALAALSDIDTDGDGVPDAVSAAFLYEGPGCVVAGG